MTGGEVVLVPGGLAELLVEAFGGPAGSGEHPDARAGWIGEALCAQIGGDTWYPAKGEPAREALTICARCPVATECLNDALAREEAHGVWGGHTVRQRRRLQRAQNTQDAQDALGSRDLGATA